MERPLQSPIDLPHERGIFHDAPSRVSPTDDRNTIRNRSIALRSAVELLGTAGRVLGSNEVEARACIAKAAALLEAESDMAERGVSTSPRPGPQQLAPWQVTHVVRFINVNLSKKIGVCDFAAVARLSSGHFARAFRATMGEAPYAYLIGCRIERAQELMLLTDKPLAEIALDCGLADQAHMTRHFGRLVGVSPGAWRRMHSVRTGHDAGSMRLNARRTCSASRAAESI